MLENCGVMNELARTYQQYIGNYVNLSKTLASSDFMAGDNYFDVGKSAIGAVVAALVSAGLPQPKHILDFACGNGRVTRHLKLMFPDAFITVCDLYPEMVEFCCKTFEVSGVISKEDLNEIDFGKTFDLIWCGSMLTHCNAHLFRSGLHTMKRALSVPGVAVATTHGRRAIALQRYSWKMSPEAAFRPAEREFYRHGFSYMRAPESEAVANFPLNAKLGIGNSLTSMSYVCDIVSEMEDAQLLYFREMAWNGHQDVFAFGTPGVFPPA